MSAFDSSKLVDTLSKVNPVGINPGHNSYITKKQRKGNLISINSLGIKKKSLNSPIHAVTNSMAPIRNISSHLAWIN